MRWLLWGKFGGEWLYLGDWAFASPEFDNAAALAFNRGDAQLCLYVPSLRDTGCEE